LDLPEVRKARPKAAITNSPAAARRGEGTPGNSGTVCAVVLVEVLVEVLHVVLVAPDELVVASIGDID
jgi:hypothetical protein